MAVPGGLLALIGWGAFYSFGIFIAGSWPGSGPRMKEIVQEKTETLFDPIEKVIQAIGRGEMVVVADDEKRENEGDLICAAQTITPEQVNFMATHGRGLVCVALTPSRVAALGLGRMNSSGGVEHKFRTAFLETVDAREGISTGISAGDRALTIRLLADPAAGPDTLVRPGHIFPIQANPMGVLGRPGHTEASTDLARLAGLEPAAVICEILDADGQMARLPSLIEFARKHGLLISSVADIHAYRQSRETLIDRDRSVRLPTEFGEFELVSYTHRLDGQQHLALVMGNPAAHAPTLVRLHSECLTGDIFHSQRCDCGEQLRTAMKRVAENGHGVVLYLRQEGRGIGLSAKLHAYELQDAGADTVEANHHLGFAADERDYTVASQMLRDIGVHSVVLISNNPRKVHGLERNGIQVVDRAPIIVTPNDHNRRYLETKRAKLGHYI